MHPSFHAAVNCLSQRWRIEAESINWTIDVDYPSSDNSTVCDDRREPSSAVNQEALTGSDIRSFEDTPYRVHLRQALFDILALRNMAKNGSTHDRSSNQN